MFDVHLNYVLKNDRLFQAYWGQLDAFENASRRQLGLSIDQLTMADWDDLLDRHTGASERLRRYLSSIPEKEMDYGRRPKDWHEFIADDAAKQALYQSSKATLLEFLADYGTLKAARLYGGVKPTESLDRKLGERKSGPGARRNMRDTWDAVRFRIVAENAPILREIGMAAWQYFIDDVVRCRNYYFHPLEDASRDAYRAIHFELEIESQRWIEIQILTEARDLIGHLDYAVVYKRLLPALDEEHESWLRKFGYKANLFDNLTISPGSVRVRAR